MKRTAVFAGTFDPVTTGHIDILKKALLLFDEVHILIAVNPDKKCFFDEESRLEMLEKSVVAAGIEDLVKVCIWHGYLYEYCEKIGSRFIVKGVRNKDDFEYEKELAEKTKEACEKIETVLLISSKEYENVSSSNVRRMLSSGKDVSAFVPEGALDLICKKMK